MIEGNQVLQIQVRTGTAKNAIGEMETAWETVQSIRGWLDLSNGDSKTTTFNAKVQESSRECKGC